MLLYWAARCPLRSSASTCMRSAMLLGGQALVTPARPSATAVVQSSAIACHGGSSSSACPSFGRQWKQRQQQRSLALAAAMPTTPDTASAPSAAASLSPDADVEAAVHTCCAALDRTPGAAEAALIERLRAEWFDTATALAEMDDATAAQLGVPLRLRSKLSQLLAAGQAEAATAQQAQQHQPAAKKGLAGISLPAQAAALVDSVFRRAQQAEPLAAASAPSDREEAGSSEGKEEEDSDWSSADAGGSSSSSSELEAAATATAAAAAEADLLDPEVQLALPIELRRCPPHGRFGNRFAEVQRVSKRPGRAEPYALRDGELTPALRREFAALQAFLTQRFFGQISDPIAPVTADKYADHLRGLLGWLHRERGVPLEELSLRSALPSHKREGVALVFDYVQWLNSARGISVRTEGLVIRSAAAAAKFLYHKETRHDAHSAEKPYSNLEVIKELRRMSNDAKRAERVAPRSSDESLKWLDWPEYLALVRELRRECAGLTAAGKPRSRRAVACSLQKYLIFAIFSCVPDRQRTVRELEVGRTLVKSGDRWVIRHGPGDYKTGKAYGERPPLVLAPHIYPELEAFMSTWRAELEPQHNLLFTQENGQPFTDKSLYKVFWTTAYRITGKKANPHSIRDSIVTYLRGGGASERELEALAIYMGHSVEMQRDVYDRRTVAQKVEPAVELLESVNARAAAGTLPSQRRA